MKTIKSWLSTAGRSAVAWAIPLARTFVAGFSTAYIASATSVGPWSPSTFQSVLIGASVAGVNAVVLVVQKVLPKVPDPIPPTPEPK